METTVIAGTAQRSSTLFQSTAVPAEILTPLGQGEANSSDPRGGSPGERSPAVVVGGPRVLVSERKKKVDHGIDEINVIELPKSSGISSDWPQRYQITVAPAALGQVLPDLPFLHKGDGITLLDGRTYWVESARQVPVKEGHVYWTWVYTATRDTSDDPTPWDEDDDMSLDSKFGR